MGSSQLCNTSSLASIPEGAPANTSETAASPLQPTLAVGNPPPTASATSNDPASSSAPSAASTTSDTASKNGPAATSSTAAVPALTPKQLKEQKKAEKAAKRAQAAQAKGAAPAAPKQQQAKQQQSKQQQAKAEKKGKGSDGPVSTIRLGPSEPGVVSAKAAIKDLDAVDDRRKDSGLVGLLRDLEVEQNEKKKKSGFGIDHAHPDVHPAILTLGMQINQRVIVGSTARCMAFLLAIKRVIEDYETPADSSLNRHLPGQYLSHQINYLISARPMAVAMGNAIRRLKTFISSISPDLTDEVAKNQLVEFIENLIHERITAADEVIRNTVCDRYIEDGDVIMTFAKSQVVEQTLLQAKERGQQFRVVIVDSRPLEEGRNLMVSLAEAGIECEYVHLYALDYAMTDVTKVFLGAHAVMANGALCSRAGTAVTAMAAHDAGIPVMVLCETIKFSDKINIDGIVNNELGSPELLVNIAQTNAPAQNGFLEGWREDAHTTVVSFMYDTTPAEYISLLICEHGCVPPEGVSGVHRFIGF